MSSGRTLFYVSALGLFLELALIRWVSSELRIFSYFKNVVLIACFLGFGSGCLLSRRSPHLLMSLLLLLLLCLIIQFPSEALQKYGPYRVSRILAEMPGLMIFRSADAVLTWAKLPGILFALGWSLLLFVVLAAIMVPLGQITGAALAQQSQALRGYSINVAGSLTGILSYSLATSMELPPVCWFVPVALLFVYLPGSQAIRKEILAVVVGILIVLLPNDHSAQRTVWSPYQKLVFADNGVMVNNIAYQNMVAQPDLMQNPDAELSRFLMPYALRLPPGKVLIVGAGVGNDVAAALGAGATAVTAVDIDPVILDLGRNYHPQKPYSDPRVTVIVDDARHFLQTTHEQFDLIVFSHLDSHTVLSSYTNVRLDDYIYTVESFRQAKERLMPAGVLFVSFWAEQPYVTMRLRRNLNEAFGHEPATRVVLETTSSGAGINSYYLIAESRWMPKLESFLKQGKNLKGYTWTSAPVVPSTDSWPFLPLSEPHIPVLMILLSTLIIVASVAFIWKARPPAEKFQGRVFWLGAAFMLLEVHNVSRLALCFGTTWQVNAWVIGTILTVILLANWVYAKLKGRGLRIQKWSIAGLFISLAFVFFVPIQSFLKYSYLFGGAAATLAVTSPIFFAAILFADAFSDSSSPNFALGWNILGAVVGGMVETMAYLIGIPNLILIASCFYLFAILSRQSFVKTAQEITSTPVPT